MFTCRGICNRVETHAKTKDRYPRGEKYCQTCGKFIFVFTAHCPCCNIILRIHPKNSGKRRASSLKNQERFIEELKIGK